MRGFAVHERNAEPITAYWDGVLDKIPSTQFAPRQLRKQTLDTHCQPKSAVAGQFISEKDMFGIRSVMHYKLNCPNLFQVVILVLALQIYGVIVIGIVGTLHVRDKGNLILRRSTVLDPNLEMCP